MTIREAYKRVSEFNTEIPSIVDQIADELSATIIEKNQNQLSLGITSEGKKIGDKPPFNNAGYFDRHKQHRQELGLQTDHVDLKMSGTFYKSLFPDFNGPLYRVLSNDDEQKVYALMYGGKSEDSSICGCKSVREGGFGEQILGLTNNNASDITEKGTEKFLKRLKLKTGF